jgi:uncharacterized protein (TIGR02996 family)
MTTEDDFNRALDANPADWQTRLVFADWLDERADPRAEGYRALGAARLYPLLAQGNYATSWYFHSGQNGVMSSHGTIAQPVNMLPEDWIRAVKAGAYNRSNNDLWVGYTTVRREAEDAVARAFATLPPARRAELLAAPPAPLPPKRRARRRKT